jgi:hypothetical protein
MIRLIGQGKNEGNTAENGPDHAKSWLVQSGCGLNQEERGPEARKGRGVITSLLQSFSGTTGNCSLIQ